MSRRRLAMLALLLIGGTATSLAAQHPRRNGFWLEIGGGGGNIHLGCSTCVEPTVTYGRSGYVRLGGGISRRVYWGLELFGLLDEDFRAGDDDTPVTIENSTVSPIILWYPWRGGMFFKGGIGITNTAVITPGIDDVPPIVVSGTGSGLTFGVGLDVPLHKWFSVTANFGVYYSAVGDVALTGTIVDDVITTVYQANFAITLR
jgi:hypothetical protein